LLLRCCVNLEIVAVWILRLLLCESWDCCCVNLETVAVWILRLLLRCCVNLEIVAVWILRLLLRCCVNLEIVAAWILRLLLCESWDCCCVNLEIAVWMLAGLCVRTVRLSECGTPHSMQFIGSSPAAAAAGTCLSRSSPSLVVSSSSGHIFTVCCAHRSTSPAQSVYIEYETLLLLHLHIYRLHNKTWIPCVLVSQTQQLLLLRALQSDRWRITEVSQHMFHSRRRTEIKTILGNV